MSAMAPSTRHTRIGDVAPKADRALSSADTFDAERLLNKTLASARAAHDYERMASVIPALLEARTQRLKAALALKRITIIDGPVGEDVKVSAGCYLIQPPQVGADGRRLRLAAFEQNVPVAIVCHEPLARVKLLPVVALSPNITVRTKVMPPKNLNKPDMTWFMGAMEALGAFAIETLDPSMSAERRMDGLLDRLDALPEHEGLHHALQQACMDARVERDAATAARAARKSAGKPAAAMDLPDGPDALDVEREAGQD